jgi:fucose 4-O-acetylase-like acetyltransferase
MAGSQSPTDAFLMSTYDNALNLARQTPATRNRYVDLLRAASILVVVIGHWLMAAPQVVSDGFSFNQLLSANTWSHYLTWILQVMPLFFLVGGFANAASWRSARLREEPYSVWFRDRMRRLVLPVLPLLAVWAIAAFTMLRVGVDPGPIWLGSQAALVPLWFLATYLLVVALTPITLRAWDRFGWSALIAGAGLAGLMDLLSLSLGFVPGGFLNYVFVWGTVHGLGYAWADSRLGGVSRRLVMSVAGLLTTTALVIAGPYPVAMVGLTTQGVNNSQPPKLTLITLALFQAGLLLAFEGPARRWLARDRAWAPVVMINGRIMTVYLWHMTAMVLVIGGLLLGGGAGLRLEVDSASWWLTRPLWLVGLYVITMPFMLIFGRFERPRDDRRPAPSTWRLVVASILICAGLGYLAASGVANDQGLHGLVVTLPFVGVIIGGIAGATKIQRIARSFADLRAREDPEAPGDSGWILSDLSLMVSRQRGVVERTEGRGAGREIHRGHTAGHAVSWDARRA